MISRPVRLLALAVAALGAAATARAAVSSGEAHVWETQEVALESSRSYVNPYVEVDCWIDLEGPGFSRRVHGFWDGGRAFRGA